MDNHLIGLSISVVRAYAKVSVLQFNRQVSIRLHVMNTTSQPHNLSLRYGMLIPLALMIASVVSGCFSYYEARRHITDDLNAAMIALANDKRELWTSRDTIDALCKMYEVTEKPVIFRASDIDFRNKSLKEEAYYTLALVDNRDDAPDIPGNKLASDSIIILAETEAGSGIALRLRGFADCSMASLIAVSDPTLPGLLLSLSLLSMVSMAVWRRRVENHSLAAEPLAAAPVTISLSGIKLTPMQRQLTQMLLDAPDRRVDKATLCMELWGGKSNAEESLYTLVRRTKSALSSSGMEIICNRGDSYELRINR